SGGMTIPGGGRAASGAILSGRIDGPHFFFAPVAGFGRGRGWNSWRACPTVAAARHPRRTPVINLKWPSFAFNSTDVPDPFYEAWATWDLPEGAQPNAIVRAIYHYHLEAHSDH